MADLDRPALNVRRGAAGAAAGALGAAALVVVLATGFFACRWAVTSAPAADRKYDVRDACERLAVPILGCAVLAGCAGWAARAPSRTAGFAATLAVVFLGSVVIWAVVGTLDLKPRLLKGERRSPLHPSEALFLFVPPVLTAGLLTIRRLRRG